MNKEEILAKSRKENKNSDLPVKDAYRTACTVSLVAVTLIAAIIHFAEHAVYGEYNIGVYTIFTAALFTWLLYLCFRLPKKLKPAVIAGTVLTGLWFGYAAFCEITSLIEFKG